MDTTNTPDAPPVEFDGAAVAAPDTPTGDDPVLDALDRAEDAYRSARATWARAAAEAGHAAEAEVRRLRGELAAERARAARQRERANRLAAALRDVRRRCSPGTSSS